VTYSLEPIYKNLDVFTLGTIILFLFYMSVFWPLKPSHLIISFDRFFILNFHFLANNNASFFLKILNFKLKKIKKKGKRLWKFCHKISFSLKKKKKKAKKKGTDTIAGNLKGWLKNSLLSYFEYCQIWLNILQDDYHLNNITKKIKINK